MPPSPLSTANVCDDELLICQNGGTCYENQRCLCPPGAKGLLCEQTKCEGEDTECDSVSGTYLSLSAFVASADKQRSCTVKIPREEAKKELGQPENVASSEEPSSSRAGVSWSLLAKRTFFTLTTAAASPHGYSIKTQDGWQPTRIYDGCSVLG
ncbi:Netrin-G2, partial [Ophiophagus hannah]